MVFHSAAQAWRGWLRQRTRAKERQAQAVFCDGGSTAGWSDDVLGSGDVLGYNMLSNMLGQLEWFAR